MLKTYQFKLKHKGSVGIISSLNLVLRTTIMTPVKPQISKFQADKILPSEL